jgi:hypothetical protein
MAFFLSRRPRTSGLLAALCLFTGSERGLQGVSAESAALPRTPAVGGRAAQIALAALVAAVAQSPLQAVEPAIASIGAKEQMVKSALTPRLKVEVLMIGDSMTVGGFGESFQGYLNRHYGSARWALYASCGSSPESWLRGEPEYVTKCGFKAITPRKTYYTDFENHRPPTPTPTPKLETLLEFHQPTTVIVQLGTNWMDALEKKDFNAERPKYAAIMEKFATALKSAKSVKQVIWITPPDSSRYSVATERNVDTLIRAAARQYGYSVINSASKTHYIAGKTGGDGVHYRKEDAYAWAESVQQDLRTKMR